MKNIAVFSVLIFLVMVHTVHAFSMNSCATGGNAMQFDSTNGIVCGMPYGVTVTHIGKSNGVSVNIGALSLGTKTVTVTGLTGLLAGDICTASWAQSQAIAVGLVLSGCRASADGQADLVFSTPIAIGISAGTINVNIAWIG